jgi:hypothetical protein
MLRGKGDLSGDQCDRELCRASFFFFQIFVWRYFLSPHAPSVASVRIADSRKLDKQIYYQKRYYVC